MTKQEAIEAWIARRTPEIKTIVELLKEADEWSVEKVENMVNGETDYRRGYSHGLQFAIDAIVELKRKGFVRPREVANILGDHQERVVLSWRYAAGHPSDVARSDYGDGVPQFSIDEWAIIREQVFARDGHFCTNCGNTEALEIDHIEPVRAGGIPTLDNLQVLCCSCNNQKQ